MAKKGQKGGKKGAKRGQNYTRVGIHWRSPTHVSKFYSHPSPNAFISFGVFHYSRTESCYSFSAAIEGKVLAIRVFSLLVLLLKHIMKVCFWLNIWVYSFSDHRPLFKSICQPDDLRLSELCSQEAEAESKSVIST